VAAALEHQTVVCSTDVSPEYREYERTVTTVADAYLRRPCGAYLAALRSLAPEVLVMTSAGGLVALAAAAARPAALLLSGPAGGVLAASAAAAAAGFPDCVTLDMGGTSTDVCLIRGAGPSRPPSAGWPGCPFACRPWTCTPSAPAGAPSRSSTRAAPWSSGPRVRGRIPARPATAGVGRDQRSPTPTWWPDAFWSTA